MPLTKYASLDDVRVLDLYGSPTRRTASLDKLSDFAEYKTEDGFLYARIRAISSRCNQNFDAWPTVELAGNTSLLDGSKVSAVDGWRVTSHDSGFTVEAKKGERYGFSTFLGKPIFVDHNNSDPSRTRGVIVDARFHVEPNTNDPYYKTADCHSSFKPASWVELLLEIDAKSFPKLAKAIVEGSKDPKKGIDGFSMGANVEKSTCSHCGNVATNNEEFCKHIRMKGAHHDYVGADGRKTSKRSFEFCHGVQFFEISAVFNPADETALIREVRASVDHEANAQLYQIAELRRNLPLDQQHQVDDILIHQGARAALEYLTQLTGQQARQPSQEPLPMSADTLYGPMDGVMARVASTDDITDELLDAPTAVQGSPDRQMAKWIHDAEKQKKVLEKAVQRAASLGEAGRIELFSFLRQANVDSATGSQALAAFDRLAEEHTPQIDLLRAPDPVDTLKPPKICEQCGVETEDGKCPVCGWEQPAEGFDDPNLDRAHENVMKRLNDEMPEEQVPGIPKEESELHDATTPMPPKPKNLGIAASVTDEMRWRIITPKEAGRINVSEKPIRSGNPPASNEPNEVTISDQLAPVTSSVRTAADFIAVAGQLTNTGDNMQHSADATAEAPEAAKPATQIDVTGIGGFDQASNEEASKAKSQVDVLGIGGVDADVSPDSTETLPDSTGEGDAGFETSKQIEAIPTKTFGDHGDSLGQQDPVTKEVPYWVTDSKWSSQHEGHDDGVFPKDDGGLAGGKAQEGNQPIAEQFGERQNLFDHPTSPANNSGPTKTWSGTDGNGVNKQQDPVTKEDYHGTGNGVTKGSSAHLFSAFKLADLEVELGLISGDQKYARVAELEAQHPELVDNSLRYAMRIKTAGLGRQTTAKRLPSFTAAKTASHPVEAAATPDASDEDAGLFL